MEDGKGLFIWLGPFTQSKQGCMKREPLETRRILSDIAAKGGPASYCGKKTQH
jgi:hypothetical protein